MPGMYLGCSIAVNGVCLTVTAFDETKNTFEFNFTLETARLTNLPDLKKGSLCNLERSMKMGDGRNSGHFVQGHVDDTGTVISRQQEGAMVVFKISLAGKVDSEGIPLMRYVVSKGYVAVDGTSLTICLVDAKEEWFTLMMVPHTLERVVTGRKQVGDIVNVEVDVMGKYVQRSVGSLGGGTHRISVMENRVTFAERVAGVALLVAVGGALFSFITRGPRT